jgi:putative membrane protein insertion efficiency factor
MRLFTIHIVGLLVLPGVILAGPFAGVGRADPRPSLEGHGAGIEASEQGYMAAVIDLFRRHLSPIDGDRCPMYPSCSRYSLEAIDKHGPVMGWIMTCDRLLRCGRDELTTASRVIVDGRWRCLDTVEDNDFWRAP